MDNTHTALQQLDAAHHLHPFNDNAALARKGTRILTKGEGCYVWDSEGNKLLDAFAGLWCVNIGYGRKELGEAAAKQMTQLAYYNSFFGCTTEPTVHLAAKLAELCPGDLNHAFFSNSGSASMGYDLPAAIGAYYGAIAERGQQRRVICLAGDGSIMMNIQELQTIAHHKLPIKIFVLNNAGYLSIRTSQTNFFKRQAGEGPSNGVSFPDFVALASAFGIRSRRITSTNWEDSVMQSLQSDGPELCEVMLDETQGFEPRMSSRRLDDGTIVSPPLEDMFPFLERDELRSNMLPANAPASK